MHRLDLRSFIGSLERECVMGKLRSIQRRSGTGYWAGRL